MATPQDISTDETAAAIPVACTLTSADLARQAAGWQRLAARAMAERAQTADGLRVSFHREPGVEDELRELVGIENDCCRWARWSVETSADQIELVVRSAGEGIATLHGMFTGMRSRS
jgi:hypothetical protein